MELILYQQAFCYLTPECWLTYPTIPGQHCEEASCKGSKEKGLSIELHAPFKTHGSVPAPCRLACPSLTPCNILLFHLLWYLNIQNHTLKVP